jgi:hypothetical protein
MSTRYKRTDWVRRRSEAYSEDCSSGFRLLGQGLLASLLTGRSFPERLIWKS